MGGAWERTQFRDVEWKGGGRVALRLVPHISAVVYVLGPGFEVRGGLMLHPAEEKVAAEASRWLKCQRD